MLMIHFGIRVSICLSVISHIVSWVCLLFIVIWSESLKYDKTSTITLGLDFDLKFVVLLNVN